MQPCEKMDAIGVRCSRGCHWHMQTARFIHDYVFIFSLRVGHESIWIIYIIQCESMGPLKDPAFLCERFLPYFHSFASKGDNKSLQSPWQKKLSLQKLRLLGGFRVQEGVKVANLEKPFELSFKCQSFIYIFTKWLRSISVIILIIFHWYMNLAWQEMEMDRAIRLVCSSKGILFQIL